MKKIIVFLLLGISVNVNAQHYVPFPTENATWNMFYAYSYTGGQMDTTLLQYSLQGDTTIRGIVYRKVCRNIGSMTEPRYKGVGGLREQDKRIYYVGESSFQFYNHENLLYDFSKSLGDTVWVDDWRPEKEFRIITYIINKIDSIKIGTEYRKRYNDRFIEGIGDVDDGLLGVITPIPTCIDCHQDWEFICFSQNGESVYKNPAYVDCDSTQKWSEKKYFGTDACWTYSYGIDRSQSYLNSDTILNGITYKKVFYRLPDLKESYSGAIREEGGKVYANINTGYNKIGNFLLYNFTVNIGDTIQSVLNNGSELSFPLIVTNIEYIFLLDGEKRKMISFDMCNPWIEGIGSVNGLFYPAYTLTTGLDTPHLICFKQNNTELYKATDWCQHDNCCDLLTGMAETQACIKLSTIVPNPTQDYAMLQFMNQNVSCTSVEIIDFLGQCIKTITSNGRLEYKLDLTTYPAGIYFVLVHSLYGNEVHKIIKL